MEPCYVTNFFSICKINSRNFRISASFHYEPTEDPVEMWNTSAELLRQFDSAFDPTGDVGINRGMLQAAFVVVFTFSLANS